MVKVLKLQVESMEQMSEVKESNFSAGALCRAYSMASVFTCA